MNATTTTRRPAARLRTALLEGAKRHAALAGALTHHRNAASALIRAGD
ncbi:hypothetical protein [Azospirillum argentinense]